MAIQSAGHHILGQLPLISNQIYVFKNFIVCFMVLIDENLDYTYTAKSDEMLR